MGSSSSTPTKRLCEQLLNRVRDEKEYKGLRHGSYDYENLAMEGGGAKGVSYVGALKALDDLGILKNIKRFAGASIGGYMAMLLAVGATVPEILEDMLADIGRRSFDSNGVSLLHNVMYHYGWHPGDKALAHFKAVLKRFTGNPDLTFEELYNMRGVELCMTTTNVSAGEVEYLHPKTTPDLSIAIAIRMTTSIPFLFQPVKWHDKTSEAHLYVDGGVTNNYPVNAFDGWYLSMEPQHSFFHTIGFEEPPFGTYNEKTLGIILFDAYERECRDTEYLKRYGFFPPRRPRTSLARKKGSQVDKAIKNRLHRGRLLTSSRHVISLFRKEGNEQRGVISREEFVETFFDSIGDQSMNRHWENVLGETPANVDADKLFDEIDLDGDNELSYHEFIRFLQKKGVPVRHGIQSAIARQISSPTDFIESIFETVLLELRRLNAKERDVCRTIGIYTDYIGTMDVKLDVRDKEFMLKQGWLATVAFLKERIGKCMFPSTMEIEFERENKKKSRSRRVYTYIFKRRKKKRTKKRKERTNRLHNSDVDVADSNAKTEPERTSKRTISWRRPLDLVDPTKYGFVCL